MAYSEFLSSTAVPVGTRPDGTLRTLIDPTTLLYDSFETLDTTNTWVIGGTVLPTGVAGQLNLAPGATVNASSFAKSQPAFTPSSNGWLVYASLYQLEVGVVTGNKRVWGLGVYVTPTFAVPVTNAVVFEIETTTGALQAAVYSNSVRTTVVALTRPTDGLAHRYSIIYRGSRVYFEIDGVTVATIQNPSLQISALSLVTVSINDTVAPSAAPVLMSTLNGVADSGRNSLKISDGIYPWRLQTVKASSSAALLTDLPAIVALHPGSPTPNFLSAQTVIGTRLNNGTSNAAGSTHLTIGGSDGTNLRPILLDATGRLNVIGTFFQATQPVSLVTNTPDVTDRAARLLGVASIRGLAIASQFTPFAAAAVGSTVGFDVEAASNVTFIVKNTVAATAWTGAPVIVFEQSDDNVSWALLGVVRNDTNLAASTHTLPANAANTEYMFDSAMEGVNFVRARVTTGTTLNGMTVVIQAGGMAFSPSVTATLNPGNNAIGNINELRAASTTVTTTAASGVAATLTLPAAGAGLFHYITSLDIYIYATAARVGAAAPVVVTTTNITGAPAFTFETAQAIGTNTPIQGLNPTTPLKSSVVNTATTIVAPAATTGIWRITATYFTGV